MLANTTPVAPLPPHPLRYVYINCLKWDHAVIQPVFFTHPYVMSIVKYANDEKHVFPLLECKSYSTGFFPLLTYLHFCFFWGSDFILSTFLSHNNRSPIFSWMYSHYSKDNISQLPVDYVWSCDWVLANGVWAEGVCVQLPGCALCWFYTGLRILWRSFFH